MRSIGLVLIVALLAGCTDRALDRAKALDAATALPDAGTCNTHFSELVPLTSLAMLDGTSAFVPTAALRVYASATVRSCDGVLSLDSNLETSELPTETLLVLASVMRGTVGCEGTHPLTRVLTVRAQPAVLEEASELVVTDGYPSDGAVVHVDLLPAPMSSACDAREDGATCTADCQCDASTGGLCLVGTDGTYRCGVPCVADNDCGAGAQCDTVTRYACVTGASCRTSCAFGEHVAECSCLVNAPPSTPIDCTCDADCPTGTLCAVSQCVVPCSGSARCGQDASPATTGFPSFCTDGVCERPNP